MKVLAAVFLAFLALSEAKIYQQCELVQTLRGLGVGNVQTLGTWVCIAFHESNYNTQAINTSTGDYGIFQLSSLFWCNNSNTPGKECDITCQSLLQDNISGDLKCAQKVFSETAASGQNGFSAWSTFQFCNGDNSGWVIC